MRQKSLSSLAVFVVALGVRLLDWSDNYREALQVQWGVAAGYLQGAQLLSDGRFEAYLKNLNLMGHPPGYPILLAVIYKLFGTSDTAIQFFQITADAVATVLVYLIASELLSQAAAIMAGLLAALSSQLAYYPLLLLPDSLCVLPILLAVYAMIRAYKHPRVPTMIVAGALVGLSCWLRPNALLLAPVLAAATPLLFERGWRLRPSAALIGGMLMVIAPITVKNAVVFHRFVPLSLGAGQTLLEGIADYDPGGKLGIPETDLNLMRQEAKLFHQPDYAASLFTGDGIERDRMRIARGLAVIRSHPLWYLGVMVRRAESLLHLARVPIVLPEQSASHSIEVNPEAVPSWTGPPSKWIMGSTVSEGAKISLSGSDLVLAGDDSKYGHQIVTLPIAVNQNTDYLCRLPIQLQQGRMIIQVAGIEHSWSLASTVVDVDERVPSNEQPARTLELPFASGPSSAMQIILSNGAQRPYARIGQIAIFELRPTAYLWTRYPRFVVRNLQRFFLTAWMLPLAVTGVALLVRARQWQTLTVLLLVPTYYVCVQSALHTERRYVIAIHYFLLMIVAVALHSLAKIVKQSWQRIVKAPGAGDTHEISG